MILEEFSLKKPFPLLLSNTPSNAFYNPGRQMEGRWMMHPFYFAEESLRVILREPQDLSALLHTMSILNSLRKKPSKIYIQGPKPLENRPLSGLFMMALQQEWDDLQSTPLSWSEWANQKLGLREKRTQVFHTLNHAINPERLSKMIWTWIEPFFMCTSFENDIARLKFESQLSLELTKHAFLQGVDKVLTLGSRRSEVQNLDVAFLEGLHQEQLISFLPQLKHEHLYGKNKASAFHGGYVDRTVIVFDDLHRGKINVGGKWERWFTLAHEMGHLESRSASIHFHSSSLTPEQNKLIERTLLHPSSPFYGWFDEMLADMFAGACLLKMSDFHPSLMEEVKTWRDVRIKDITNMVRFLDYPTAFDTHLPTCSEAGKAILNIFNLSPYGNCSNVLDELLKAEKQAYLRALPAQDVFSWVMQECSDVMLDKLLHGTFEFKNREGNLKQGAYSDLLETIFHLKLQGMDATIPGKNEYSSFLETPFYHFAIAQAHHSSFEKVLTYLEQHDKASPQCLDWMKTHREELERRLNETKEAFPRAWKHFVKAAPMTQPDYKGACLTKAVQMQTQTPFNTLFEHFFTTWMKDSPEIPQGFIIERYQEHKQSWSSVQALMGELNTQTNPSLTLEKTLDNLHAQRTQKTTSQSQNIGKPVF